MKVLLVEDDGNYAELLSNALRDEGIDDITVAISRTSGINIGTSQVFDLVICDLKLPTTDGALDLDRDHGLAVYGTLMERNPGIPVLIHSAHGDMGLVERLMAGAPREDIFGNGIHVPMLRCLEKGDLEPCIRHVREFRQELDILDQIEIRPLGNWVPVGTEARAIRMFTRHRGGICVHVRDLGGFSSATTVELTVTGEGIATSYAVAKLGEATVIDGEKEAYNTHVTSGLPAGTFAPLNWEVRAGAGRTRGIFYSLAAQGDTLLTLLARDPEAASRTIDVIRTSWARWEGDAVERQHTVRDIRAQFVSDEEMEGYDELLRDIDRGAVEGRSLLIRECCQHGDLHGSNVLVNPEGSPLIIDYGSVGIAAACLDPVTLELSVITQPEGRDAVRGWPNPSEAEHWIELDQWADNSPIPQFLRRCREWALAASNQSQRAVCACAYALALRQLKYPDVNRDVAVSLVISAARGIEAT